MAKKFFFVCAGLLALALTYHLGAQSVSAQGVGRYVVGSFDPDSDPLVIDSAGRMWMMGRANSPGVQVGPVPLPKPGTVLEATASVVGGTFEAFVLYDDGEAYHFDRSSWQYLGNVAEGATEAGRASWGSMKARYR